MAFPLSDYGYSSKQEVLDDAKRYWNPDKTAFWQDEGIPLVIGEREGYVLTDLDGHRLIDMHLNGGTYNIGHRNPRAIAALTRALEHADVGNHHFPAVARTALARELVRTAPEGIEKVVFGSSGGESVDLAIKSARWATGRRRIVSIRKAYHGHTGLSIGAGDERFSRLFHADRSDEFVQVPFNDLDAMAEVLAAGDVAAVILETIPATYGFPLPDPGYLAAVAELAHRTGALYIADEVQTGLMRTGALWAITKSGAQPDIIVTGKGLGGGIYPVTAALLNGRAAGWLEVDGFAHMATFGGSEVGAAVALEVLDIVTAPETVANVRRQSARLADAFAELMIRFPGALVGIRQDGLVIGLEFSPAIGGAKPVMRGLYERGVWAIFSTLDPVVLQFKPGLLVDDDTVDQAVAALTGTLESLAVPA
ncbi:class-III pyridoxal-phosphate-dependent aminotransferase [Mycetocola reblochoni]|uniref:Aminotransferase class-III n=2 Tax=Mycetocola reblochoni TaxID=331618 RepID=A0A1R4JYQ9_9MICO|nr:aminotransferase class III-fold pyridoxal phosphate-dependent enzyme [Mycetocola reblochoni]RLP67964.1 aspartate aminotransferase family protein [Mycetocola reblochoni]SJN37098.1 Aminotransferase class-III [Mycetocola reblochoni REB411]